MLCLKQSAKQRGRVDAGPSFNRLSAVGCDHDEDTFGIRRCSQPLTGHFAPKGGVHMTNLIIAYDLNRPGQNYEAVSSAIRSLGSWYKLQYSLFFVEADLTIKQAYDFIRAFMDQNDKLMVADARDMRFGNYAASDIAAIQAQWSNAA